SDKPNTIETDDSRLDRIEEMITNPNERIRTLENIIINQKPDILNLKIKNRVHERKFWRVSQILGRSSQTMATKVVGSYANDLKNSKIQEKHEVLVKKKRLLEGSMVTTPVPTQKAVTAFYAYMSKSENIPGTHHTLIFDTAITNENNGYHPFSGIFIAPEKGIYVFSFSIRLECHSYGPYELVKNSQVVGVVFSDIRQVCLQDQITGTMVITANKGDDIYVRTHATTSHIGLIPSDDNGRSSFAGWLILN
ncbi:Hypothetical predicted protein, partial [Mytilus galloprovincialis]